MCSKFLYGFHEPPPTGVLRQGGWILHLVEVGTSREPHPGINLSNWKGYGNIVRLQHAWGSGAGTFPVGRMWMEYIKRVRSCAENSPEAHIWQAGNEPNHPNEWPDHKPITAENSAWWYSRIRDTIHEVQGHENDQVLLPPVAPWCVVKGVRDWIPYFKQMIYNVEGDIDGFAIHAYSRGWDPASITSETRMDPPYNQYRNGFRVYRDWIGAIPRDHWDKPIYLTETNQYNEWEDKNTGWVKEMYREIDDWNRGTGPEILCALLYRWPNYDQWGIDGKWNVVDDFRGAWAKGYLSPGWAPEPEPPIEPEPPEPEPPDPEPEPERFEIELKLTIRANGQERQYIVPLIDVTDGV